MLKTLIVLPVSVSSILVKVSASLELLECDRERTGLMASLTVSPIDS
jgi:hypothetical protein